MGGQSPRCALQQLLIPGRGPRSLLTSQERPLESSPAPTLKDIPLPRNGSRGLQVASAG